MWLTGTRNLLTTAILSGNVQLTSQGRAARRPGAQRPSFAEGTLHFVGQQMLETVHAEDGVRLYSEERTGERDLGSAQGRLRGRPSLHYRTGRRKILR